MLVLATFVKSNTPSRSFAEVVATVTALSVSGTLPPSAARNAKLYFNC
jgi:hypothetical protein